MRNNKTLVALIGVVITAIMVVAAVLILVIVLNNGSDSNDDIKGKIVLNPIAVIDSILPGTTKTVEIKAELKDIKIEENESTEKTTLIWTIDNDKVATINGNGDKATLTLKSVGNAIVTVTYGDISATCNVIINELVPKITLSETNISETYIKGKTTAVTITATAENVPETLTWKSSNENVAKINGIGNTRTITIVGTGTARITVSGGCTSATCTISVVPKITITRWSSAVNANVSATHVELYPGDIIHLHIDADNLTSAQIDQIEWTISDKGVAKLTGGATHTGKDVVLTTPFDPVPKVGSKATITAKYGSATAKCVVEIVDAN